MELSQIFQSLRNIGEGNEKYGNTRRKRKNLTGGQGVAGSNPAAPTKFFEYR